MHVAIKHRQLLDRNPFRATHLLVKANKDKIFGSVLSMLSGAVAKRQHLPVLISSYVPHNFERPDSESQFAIGLTDNYSLDSGIAYSLNNGGLGSDQCWRNKSQNRAALSLLCTFSEQTTSVSRTIDDLATQRALDYLDQHYGNST